MGPPSALVAGVGDVVAVGAATTGPTDIVAADVAGGAVGGVGTGVSAANAEPATSTDAIVTALNKRIVITTSVVSGSPTIRQTAKLVASTA